MPARAATVTGVTITSPGTAAAVDRSAEHDALREIYRTIRTIAVVGASANEAKEAHRIPAYLASQGFDVVAVSPRPGELFDNPVAASLSEVGRPIDVVDVFRPPAEALQVAQAAVDSGAKILWFQPGTQTDEAIQHAALAGLTVVSRRCMGATHGALGLGPGPD